MQFDESEEFSMIDEKIAIDFFKSLTKDQRHILRKLIREETGIPYRSVKEYVQTIDKHFLHGQATCDVYDHYINFCLQHEFYPISKITFSKCITKSFPVYIQDKKIKGKKYRLFVVKDGAGI